MTSPHNKLCVSNFIMLKQICNTNGKLQKSTFKMSQQVQKDVKLYMSTQSALQYSQYPLNDRIYRVPTSGSSDECFQHHSIIHVVQNLHSIKTRFVPNLRLHSRHSESHTPNLFVSNNWLLVTTGHYFLAELANLQMRWKDEQTIHQQHHQHMALLTSGQEHSSLL